MLVNVIILIYVFTNNFKRKINPYTSSFYGIHKFFTALKIIILKIKGTKKKKLGKERMNENSKLLKMNKYKNMLYKIYGVYDMIILLYTIIWFLQH